MEETGEGRIRVRTPPDPRTGETEVELDPVEFVHVLGRQVPDPGQHMVRYYGVYANRSRREWQARWRGEPWGDGEAPLAVTPSEAEKSGHGGRAGGSGLEGGGEGRVEARFGAVGPVPGLESDPRMSRWPRASQCRPCFRRFLVKPSETG